MDQYAVVGNPISHSKSPLIHAEFAKEMHQELTYSKIEAPLNGFTSRVREFFEQGGKGLNVTVPFKEEAWSLCQSLSDRGQLAGAVNTLYLNSDGQICGDNTDGVGLVNDLKQTGFSFAGKKILIIGAGGAVRGVIQPILNEMPTSLTITNRTKAKADSLAEVFSEHGLVVSEEMGCVNGPFDLVINGTSASLAGALPAISSDVFTPSTVVYDMMYAKEGTVFNRWAAQQGAAEIYDGLGMLVEQAAEAFYIWRRCRPNTQRVVKLLRDA